MSVPASTASTITPTLAQVARLREVVGAAFVDDPMFQWLFHEPSGRADACAAWLGLFVEAFALGGTVDVVTGADGAVAGAALWRLGQGEMPFPVAPSVGGLMVAVLGAELTMARGGALRAFAEHKPAPPFHYLQFLAVHPAHQGQGLGRVLLGHGLQRAAASGTPVYLESTNPRNLAFYHSMGLSQLGTFTLEADGPPAYRMWWQP
ncbi:MAG: GNAT family N-acetyltransferase [Acidimicrobiaceae bacterium]|nr:GNAT family N-acetyltransferase [Ilumatobacter sp.]MCB9380663.1 GNAT family N-acetyltransferase [Acidimicrobiaceae bacterium]MCO5329149.1 GNAT family N-acetyltransferase [Ilumatobacteraceae bacterium]